MFVDILPDIPEAMTELPISAFYLDPDLDAGTAILAQVREEMEQMLSHMWM